MGGWHTTADVNNDDDVLFATSSLTTLDPSPITISNYSSWVPFGPFHLNDPTVVAAPDGSGALIMFVTCLDDKSITSDPNTINYFNSVCMLQSTNQGVTWNFYGDVVYQTNNAVGNIWLGNPGTPLPDLDILGAWAPSAIVVNNKIYVYYNTNQPNPNNMPAPANLKQPPTILVCQFPAPFTPQVMTALDSPAHALTLYTTPVVFHSPQPPAGILPYLYATNPRVFKDPVNGNYIMLAQNGADTLAGYTSTDGINWYPLLAGSADGTLVSFPIDSNVLAPQLTSTGSPGKYNLYYATPWNNFYGTLATTLGTQQCVSGFEKPSTNNCSFFSHSVLTLH